jgi:hypothetical protein
MDWPREPTLADLLVRNQNLDEESALADLLMKTSGGPGVLKVHLGPIDFGDLKQPK